MPGSPTGLAASPPGRRASSAGSIIGLLVGSAFVMVLNETLMSVALQVLTTDLRITESTAQWLTSGFLLMMAVVIPTTGFLLQRFPVRRVYLTAMAAFSLGTLICALAPGFPALLAGRLVQATGTAVMIPLLFTSAMTLVEPERRGRTMGTIMVVIAVAPAVGPTLSGLVLSRLDWPWLFWIVLPIALVALGVGALRLHVDVDTRPVPLDVVSVVLSAVGFSGVVYGITALGASARGDAPVSPWLPIVVGAVALTLFVARQLRLQRDDRALLDLRPFTHRRFVVSLLVVGLGMLTMFGAVILLPFYVQGVLGHSVFVAGVVVLPGGLVMGLLGRPVGRLYDRVGARRLVVPGTVLVAAAMVVMTTLDGASPLVLVVAVYVLVCGGIGLLMTPLMTDALSSLPGPLYSHGSAILTTFQQVAAAAGTALFVTITTVFSRAPGGAADVTGLHAAFVVGAAVSVLLVALSLLIRRREQTADVSDSPTTEEAPELVAA